MAAIRRMLTWWDQGDAGRVIALSRGIPEGDPEGQKLEAAARDLDRRVADLTLELANQGRYKGAHAE